ncbi:MAG: tRNA (cytidine/uridine-2'-O-)-methyltransferase TrmJ [Steroidobacteraceae bacterium]|nr:tRNA (cytidine/uridine-2'-O-)-methyltransferase TrmJ [Steroidobacteraceae bacterium]
MLAADIRFVLVGTQHPGNIGAVARAMKNMALERLVLVRPREFPHAEATARASGADDVLAAARVVDRLEAAIGDCGLVVATTAREREHNHRVLDIRDAAPRIVAEAARGPVAVLFGGERAGLSNDEIDAAHMLARIPANPAYTSLNLAMAAQLIGYEIHRARGAQVTTAPGAVPLATVTELERFFEHLDAVLAEIDFRDRTASGTHLRQRLRRLFQRAEMDQNEVNILRGILAAVQGRRKVAGSKCPPRSA